MDNGLMADGIISLDDRPAIEAVNRANAGLDGHEKKVKTVLDRSGKEWQVYGDAVVRVSDKSKTSLDRLLQSMEKQSQMAGKSGVERLIAQRDQLISRWQKEQSAVDSITKSYEKLIKAEEGKGEGSKFGGFAEKAKEFFENPLQSIKGTATSVMEAMGPLWSGIAAGAAALGTLAAVGFEAAKSLAEYGLSIKNVELRTGLASKEVGQFSFAARMAGQDASIFERMMRGLAQASDDQSKDGERARTTLRGMGVDLRGLTGEMRPTSQILLEISEALNKLPAGAQRDAAAMDLFKRAGIEAIPVISGLTENVKRAKELGLGATEEDLQRWERYHQNVTEAEVLWERFTRKIKEPLAAVVTLLLRDGQGKPYSFQELAERGINFGAYAPRTGAQNNADLRGAGFGSLVDQKQGWFTANALDAASDYTGKIEQRRAGDAAVAAYVRSQGIDGQLKAAEDALGKMSKPETGVSSVEDVAAFRAQERKVAGLKEQIAAAKTAAQEVAAFHRSADEYVRKGEEQELDAIQKIYFERDRLIAQAKNLHSVESDIARIRKTADTEAGELATKANTWITGEVDSANSKRMLASILASGPSKEDLKQWVDNYTTDQQIQSIAFEGQKDSLNRRAGAAGRMVQMSGATGLDAINETYQIRIELANQLAAIEADRIAKQETGNDQLKAAAQALNVLAKETAEAQQEAMLKTLELQKQQIDSLKKETEGLWTTLLTHPAKFPKQLGETIHAAVIKPVADGMASITASAIRPIIYGADGGGGIAGAFRGVFGGAKQDPVKVSTDMNTAATAQNSAVMASLTAVIAGMMGISAPAIASAGGIGGVSMPSISAPSVSGVRGWGSATGGGGGDIMSLPTIDRSGPVWLPGGGSVSAGGGYGGGDASSGGFGGWPSVGIGGAARGNPLGSLIGSTIRGGTGGAGGFSAGGLIGAFKNFKLGGLTRSAGSNVVGYGPDGTPHDDMGNPVIDNGDGKITGVNGAAGALMGAGGMMLAQQGLLGSSRGTAAGTAMGAVGGASIGYSQGGLEGALFGGFIGLGIGLGEMLFGVESPVNEAKRLVKQQYGVSIDTAIANQIVSIAQSKYANHISIAVRDPDVRKMLMLYAQGTGQKMPLSATTPQAGSLAEMGGKLYQQATFNNGVANTFQSNLPVLGPSGGTYPTPAGPNSSAGMGPISLHITGADVATFMTGQYVTPQFVTDQSMNAHQAGYGLTQMAANYMVPGLTTGT